jgi:protein required for attachment to host cells
VSYDDVTWIVTADASEARFFTERFRAGPVVERPDLKMQADPTDLAHAKPRATVHARVGEARHAAGDRSPGEAAEHRFLKEVGDVLARHYASGDYQRLVLMAPPKALGVLTAALPTRLQAQLEASDPHERKGEPADAIRLHLRHARARA